MEKQQRVAALSIQVAETPRVAGNRNASSGRLCPGEFLSPCLRSRFLEEHEPDPRSCVCESVAATATPTDVDALTERGGLENSGLSRGFASARHPPW